MLYWVTTFNEELYTATGKQLIESFIDTESEGRLYPFPEGKALTEQITNIFPHMLGVTDILTYKPLTAWLKKPEIRARIPEYLGGTSQPCLCSNPYGKRDRDHKRNCHFTWWNRNWSRWFRKIVALEYFISTKDIGEDDIIFWLDSDCFFQQRVTEKFIAEEIVCNADCIYFKGHKREVEETGIVGFKGTNGCKIIYDWLDQYLSQSIFNCVRWDDCYAFQKVRKLNGHHFTMVDIAGKKIENGDVVTKSILGPYILHNKGTHGRKLGLMK